MPRHLRFCVVCRGIHDDRSIRCSICDKPFHSECAAIPSSQVLTNSFKSSWQCVFCHNEAAERVKSAPTKVLKKLPEDVAMDAMLRKRFQYVREVSARVNDCRRRFLRTQKEYLLPFCSSHILDKAINQSITRRDTSNPWKDHDTEPMRESPSFINAKIRDYQLVGINKMFSWYLRGVGGILADEMGLGKTLQTISLMSRLKNNLNVEGPHLIIVPLAVIHNWGNEFARFAPDLKVKKLYGVFNERKQIVEQEKVYRGYYDVYLTTYETVVCEEAFFSDTFQWCSVTIDEGQRIKNEDTVLRRALNRIRCPFRLLLTGTPLQNNLHELWALLNYILPDVFVDSEIFDEAAKIAEDEMNMTVCKNARLLLENTMMIRRTKSVVEKSLLPKRQCVIKVSMTPLQVQWYKSLLEKDIGVILKKLMTGSQMRSIISQLRKVVNHPKQIYNNREAKRVVEENRLKRGYYTGCEFQTTSDDLIRPLPDTNEYAVEETLKTMKGEDLIQNCGKLHMLDRLLVKLKADGSRVLIFSQFKETLDILEEAVTYRFGPKGEQYFRLDGETSRINRELDIREFNRAGAEVFIYLISTKAGGVGLNLATADSVVLYDSSHNPQVDLQAQDRAHRIGQTKQVTVYKMVTQRTFEENLQNIAGRKLALDQSIIGQEGDDRKIEDADDDENIDVVRLSSLIKFDAMKIMDSEGGNTDGIMKSDSEIDAELEKFIRRAANSEEGLQDEDSKIDMDDGEMEMEEQSKKEEVEMELSDNYCGDDIHSSINNSIGLKENDDFGKNGGDEEVKGKRMRKQTSIFNPPGWANNVNKKKRSHERVCFCCDMNNDDDDLIECYQCPKAYHKDCLGLEESPANNKMVCPWHSCIECDRSCANSGGQQFRCLSCPISYCFDCYPPTMEMIKIEPSSGFINCFIRHGFVPPQNAIYTRCEECLKERKEKNSVKSKPAAQKTKDKREAHLKPMLPTGDLSVGLQYLYSGSPGGGKFMKADSFEIQTQLRHVTQVNRNTRDKSHKRFLYGDPGQGAYVVKQDPRLVEQKRERDKKLKLLKSCDFDAYSDNLYGTIFLKTTDPRCIAARKAKEDKKLSQTLKLASTDVEPSLSFSLSTTTPCDLGYGQSPRAINTAITPSSSIAALINIDCGSANPSTPATVDQVINKITVANKNGREVIVIDDSDEDEDNDEDEATFVSASTVIGNSRNASAFTASHKRALSTKSTKPLTFPKVSNISTLAKRPTHPYKIGTIFYAKLTSWYTNVEDCPYPECEKYYVRGIVENRSKNGKCYTCNFPVFDLTSVLLHRYFEEQVEFQLFRDAKLVTAAEMARYDQPAS